MSWWRVWFVLQFSVMCLLDLSKGVSQRTCMQQDWGVFMKHPTDNCNFRLPSLFWKDGQMHKVRRMDSPAYFPLWSFQQKGWILGQQVHPGNMSRCIDVLRLKRCLCFSVLLPKLGMILSATHWLCWSLRWGLVVVATFQTRVTWMSVRIREVISVDLWSWGGIQVVFHTQLFYTVLVSQLCKICMARKWCLMVVPVQFWSPCSISLFSSPENDVM